MRIFNRFFAALFCLSCVSICRSQDVNSLPAENDATVYSFGVSGTVAFVNPKELNESFHMVNTTLDLAVPRVNTIFVAGAHLRMSVNAQSHIVLRGEFIRIFRQFEYDAKEISLAGVQTGVFRVRNERSWVPGHISIDKKRLNLRSDSCTCSASLKRKGQWNPTDRSNRPWRGGVGASGVL